MHTYPAAVDTAHSTYDMLPGYLKTLAHPCTEPQSLPPSPTSPPPSRTWAGYGSWVVAQQRHQHLPRLAGAAVLAAQCRKLEPGVRVLVHPHHQAAHAEQALPYLGEGGGERETGVGDVHGARGGSGRGVCVVLCKHTTLRHPTPSFFPVAPPPALTPPHLESRPLPPDIPTHPFLPTPHPSPPHAAAPPAAACATAPG